MQITYAKSDATPTKTIFIIDRAFETISCVSGDIATEVLSQVKAAPMSRTIHFREVQKIDMSVIDCAALKQLAVKNDISRLNIAGYTSICKQIQAILANAGHPVIDVYGLRYNQSVYGFDYGFEIRVEENFSIFVDFAFCYKTNHNKTVYGCTIDGKELMEPKRTTGSFETNNIFRLSVAKVPTLLKSIFPDVRTRNLAFLPDMSLVLEGMYSSLDENTIMFIEPDGERLNVKAKILIVDSVDIANALRNQGADIVAKGATSSKNQELINIGLVKVKQASALDSLGVIGLCNTSNTGILKSQIDYEQVRYKVINGQPSTDDLYKFLYSANKRVLGAGNIGVIKPESLSVIVDSIIAEEIDVTSNTLHQVCSDNNEVIGTLSCYSNTTTRRSQAEIGMDALTYLKCEDNLITSSELSEIAVTSLNASSFLKEQKKKLDECKAKAAAMNYDSIISNILYIDRQVSECFKAFATLEASAQLMAARAAVYLKAIKQILQFPLKTGYSAISAGLLAEHISIDSLQNRAIINSSKLPYFSRQHYKCCYGTFTINNGDPGHDQGNDIFVGSVYASLLNDVDGGVRLHKYKNKPYVITYEQTHGSGKCKKVVVPFNQTESRITENYGEFQTEIVQILNSLLSKPIMITLKDVKAAVKDVAESCTNIGKRREPYQRKLIEFMEWQQQIFMLEHVISLIENDFRYDNSLTVPKNCEFLSITDSTTEPIQGELVENTENISAKQIVGEAFSRDTRLISLMNSISRGISIKDLHITMDNAEISKYNDHLKTIKEKQRQMRKLIAEAIADDTLQTVTDDTSEDYNLKIPMLEEDVDYEFVTLYEINNNPDKVSTIKIPSSCKNQFAELDELVKKEYDEALKVAASFKKRLSENIHQVDYLWNGSTENIQVSDYDSLDSSYKAIIDEKRDIYLKNKDIYNTVSKMDRGKEEHILTISVNNKKFRYLALHGNNSKNDDQDSLIRNSQTRVSIILPISLEDKQQNNNEESIISIGGLCYSLQTLLKHEHIFEFMPYSNAIADKIKYALFRNTDVSSGEVYNEIEKRYGNSIAAYFSEWMSKEESNRNMIAKIIYALTANPKRTFASLLAFQGDQLGVFLKNCGLESYNVSCVDSCVQKLLL